ncbi:MAG: hypothetical protein RIK87_07680 [Fuerstiella sp.]
MEYNWNVEQAILEIESKGGDVTRNASGFVTSVSIRDSEEIWCIQHFASLEELDSTSSALDDVVWSSLSDTSPLRILTLWNPSVSDHGLANITRFTSLRHLTLKNCSISDAGLKHIAKLSQLEILELPECPNVTSVGVAYLGELCRLKSLDLSNTSIDDDALETASRFPRLETLAAAETEVTDIGVAHLRSHATLSFVALLHTRLSEQSLDHLATIENLKVLYFGGTVTKASIPMFKRMSNLRELYFSDEMQDDQDCVAAIEEALPTVSVCVFD